MQFDSFSIKFVGPDLEINTTRKKARKASCNERSVASVACCDEKGEESIRKKLDPIDEKKNPNRSERKAGKASWNEKSVAWVQIQIHIQIRKKKHAR